MEPFLFSFLTLETQEVAWDRKQRWRIAVARDNKARRSWNQCLHWRRHWARSVAKDHSSPNNMRRAEMRRRTCGIKPVVFITEIIFESFAWEHLLHLIAILDVFERITVFVTVMANCRSSPEEDEGMRSGWTEIKGVTLCVWAHSSCMDTHTDKADSLW